MNIILRQKISLLINLARADGDFAQEERQLITELATSNGLSKQEIQVIQVMISAQTTQQQTFWGRTFAGATLASLPVIILFMLLQRYYVQGVAQTGVKG
jgi:ABC-type maltose transport system permease subunit